MAARKHTPDASGSGDGALMARALRWSELFSRWSDARRDELLQSANLVETYGLERQAGVNVRLRLSQHHLAAMLGLSRQTINKELSALADERIIELGYKHVSVRDPVALRSIGAEG